MKRDIPIEVETELLREIMRKKPLFLRCRGRSMGYSIRDGELMEVRYIPPKEISRGDIVLFMKEGKLFSHRVIRIIEGDGELKFVIKGDVLLDIDGYIPSSAIIGRVEGVIREGRKITLRKKNRYLPLLIAFYSHILYRTLGRSNFYRTFWDNPPSSGWKRGFLRFSERIYRLPLRLLSFFERRN